MIELEDIKELEKEAQEIRELIVEVVSHNGGHLGSSLGVVELSIVLHKVFDTPRDVLIWDVGHQAYAYKILTGRKLRFGTLRKKGGISGFPNREESEYDAFGTGHAGTAISATLGFAMEAKLRGDDKRQHVAVVGDASILSGLSFEGILNAGVSDCNMLILLNDNGMSISQRVGNVRDWRVFFENFGVRYLGEIDGHNFVELFENLERAKGIFGVKALVVRTEKGKGVSYAEQDKVFFHSPTPFDAKTGEVVKREVTGDRYQDVFGISLAELAGQNDKIVAVTPAMVYGSSLNFMEEKFPQRCFDVGISEQHAVTFSAGMSAAGMRPFCAIYSTFLQRGYDGVIHDVAIQNLPVVFCIDRAGYPTDDGVTHQGMFDIAFLNCVPNMVILTPSDERELRNMMYVVQKDDWKSPVAIRYPRGRGEMRDWHKEFEVIDLEEVIKVREGEEVVFLSAGVAKKRVENYMNKMGVNGGHYCFRKVKPINEGALGEIFGKYKKVITVEEGCVEGGFGSVVSDVASRLGASVVVEHMDLREF